MVKSNWILRSALVGMSLTLASFGVLGWAYAAGALDAPKTSLGAFVAGMHDKAGGLWILFLVACIGCVLAQIIAACAVVNFARLAKASWIWRALAVAFYGACVVFAAYSADRAGKFVLSSSHYAMYQAREEERAALTAEITAHNALIARELAALPADTAGTVTTRQEQARLRFALTTDGPRQRVKEAQRELQAKPPLPAERAAGIEDGFVFLIFLALALLEPWGYALAERGMVPKDATRGSRGARVPPKSGANPESVPPKRAPNVFPLPLESAQRVAKAAGGTVAGIMSALTMAAPAPAEASQPAIEPTPITATVADTDDGSSEFDPPPVERVRKSKPRGAPPSLPPEIAVAEADEFARANGGKFSSHAIARQLRAKGMKNRSQPVFARSLRAAADRGMLDDKPWAEAWRSQKWSPRRSVA